MATGHVRLTVGERVLVHLLGYIRFADRKIAPPAVTQQGIAEALSVRRSHVTVALQGLAGRGLVDVQTARIQDAARRKKAYFLTPAGYARAMETKARVESLTYMAGTLTGVGPQIR